MRGVLLVVILLLAGCSGAADPPGSSATSSSAVSSSQAPAASNTTKAPTSVQAFTLDGCRNVGGVFPVPMDAARAALPDGFEPVAADDPQGGAVLYAIAVDCAGSSVDGNDTGPAFLGYAELAVTPPADLIVDGVTDCTVPLFFATSNSALGLVVETLGLGLAGQSESSSRTNVTYDDVVQQGQMRLVLQGITLQLTYAFAGPPTGSVASGSFVLYGVQDGQVRSVLKGTSSDGTAVQGPVLLQAAGVPVASQARQPALGFSADGFSLAFERQALPAP